MFEQTILNLLKKQVQNWFTEQLPKLVMFDVDGDGVKDDAAKVARLMQERVERVLHALEEAYAAADLSKIIAGVNAVIIGVKTVVGAVDRHKLAEKLFSCREDVMAILSLGMQLFEFFCVKKGVVPPTPKAIEEKKPAAPAAPAAQPKGEKK